MKPFRFTVERVFELMQNLKDSSDAFAKALNDDLEAEEAKCERVWGYIDDDFGMMVYMDDENGPHKFTHTAMLWNVDEIGDGKNAQVRALV